MADRRFCYRVDWQTKKEGEVKYDRGAFYVGAADITRALSKANGYLRETIPDAEVMEIEKEGELI